MSRCRRGAVFIIWHVARIISRVLRLSPADVTAEVASLFASDDARSWGDR